MKEKGVLRIYEIGSRVTEPLTYSEALRRLREESIAERKVVYLTDTRTGKIVGACRMVVAV